MILLPTEELVLVAVGGDQDQHGWTLPPAEPAWTGQGAVQVTVGITSAGADAQGGAGPYSPRTVLSGSAYLPEEAAPVDGMTLRTRRASYVLSDVRWVADPVGGPLSCWVATISASPAIPAQPAASGAS